LTGYAAVEGSLEQLSLPLLREAQVVGMDEIRDRTRGVLDFSGWASIEDGVRHTVKTIKLDPWGGSWPLLVVESESLAGVLEPLAAEYRMPLIPLRGQASCGFLGGEVPAYVRDGTPVLYLGDWDFSGGHIEQSAHEELRHTRVCASPGSVSRSPRRRSRSSGCW
jgi:hypothetical protein